MTASVTPVEEISLAREGKEWFAVSITRNVNGTSTPVDPAELQFALLPLGVRPSETDWFTPVVDPDSSGAVGIQLEPVTGEQSLGIWAQITTATERPVLEPREVGYVKRT